MNASNIDRSYYQPPKKEWWIGRIDSESDPEQLRYHQVVELEDLDALTTNRKIVVLGFASDEGVKRNKGRQGAEEGPIVFRNAISSLCWHKHGERLKDVGNIYCKEGKLEQAQVELAKAVRLLLKHNKQPFVIGGGHETAFGHYLGISTYLKEQWEDARLGIINIDAHFDLRPYGQAPHSGSPFLQAFDHARITEFKLNYFVYGINKDNNTPSLFRTANELGVEWVENTHILNDEFDALNKVKAFIEKQYLIYVTICLDVFNAAIAPGVSAPAWNGLNLQHALNVLQLVKESGKLISADICELNPAFDEDGRTAKVAGSLFSEIIR